MTQEYYKLDRCADVPNLNDLSISRTKALLEAITQNNDYSFIKLMRFPASGELEAECIIVEVECDGIPSRNTVGLQYRERLALFIPIDTEQLVQVFALRKNFPTLMHQNQRGRDQPASLCLYFEPTISVLRTWTPQNFLRRIQWWLEKSSKNELHPADQPVENLFFQSKYELILPWDFEELRKNHSSFIIRRGSLRENEGFACHLLVDQNQSTKDIRLKFIQLELPPIIHGIVESNPINFGELFDLLSNRNVNLIDELRSVLHDLIDEKGTSVLQKNEGTLILLQIPLSRSVDNQPEHVIYRAFLTQTDLFDLGIELNILMEHENVYYRYTPIFADQKINDTKWRDHPLEAVDVLRINTPQTAREQSGINEEGPTGVLIGAGSLGSTLINLWGRSGWGKWTIVDKDYIKPHNLSRHVAHRYHVGEPKATVVAQIHSLAVDNASTITSLIADATDLIKDSSSPILRTASIVIDASTTLEYPRAASNDDSLSRHISVFITPDGNGAVLLVEDIERKIKLRTLEAQYYRALLQHELGNAHLSNTIGTFWSGAGCRDISVVLPYSRIMGQACTVAEQIQKLALLPEASIKIWQRDPETSATCAYNFPVQLEHYFSLDDITLFIDNGVLDLLFQMRKQCLPNETGGVLLGYYDFNIKAVVIVTAMPAPLDSKSTPISFERGTLGLAKKIQEAMDRTMGMVGYIGEWHSHPPGHSTSMSRDDIVQLTHLAQGMAEDGLPAISLIVGDDDFQVFKGERS
ncbi:ThiF family adenylyltransferase [Acinetobacter baumannii]